MRPNCPDCGKELHKILNPKANVYYACLYCKHTFVDHGDGKLGSCRDEVCDIAFNEKENKI